PRPSSRRFISPLSLRPYPLHLARHSFPTRRSSDLTRPVSAAHSGQQRRTVSGALFGLYCLNFVPIDVCLNLSPKRGTSASTSKPDRKSTRLNSSHGSISYAVFCLKKKNN